MESKALISVIVPVYNVAEYLPRCICSLLSQSYPHFELILVDDGSTDRGGTVCDAYAEKDERIRVFHQKNGGLSAARNTGLGAASGNLIAFVDSDDWVSETFLERLYDALLKANADICECRTLKVSSEAEVKASASGKDWAEDENAIPVWFDTEDALRELICDSVFHQTVWNKLYRREVVEGIFFEVGKTNEDEFWTYQVFGRAGKVVKIDTPLYYYFQRPGSIMGVSYNLKRLDALEAKAERQKYVEKHFPALESLAKRSLIGSCLYAGQMSLKNLEKEARKAAVLKIDDIRNAYPLERKDMAGVGFREGLWLRLSRWTFWGTARFKNLLKKGF